MMRLVTPIKRLRMLWQRRHAARRLGVKFDRAATFELPETMRLNGKDVPLRLPREHGIKIAFVDLLLDDCYGLRQLVRRRQSIARIVDIGANVGLFGLAARSVFPDAEIHAYEPNPALKEMLAHQAEIAGFKPYLEAVGREPGLISLAVDTAESVQSQSRPEPTGGIPQIAFREAIARIGGHADLVKMDCEGAEWDILKDRESWRGGKNLSMEYHLFDPQASGRRIRSLIEDLDFTITSFVPIDNYGLLIATQKGLH